MKRILSAAAVAALALSPCEAHADVFSGLLGYWSFNGTAADQSGNGNDLSLFGGAAFAPGGQFGEALSLDGVLGSYAQQTTDNTAFDLGSNDFTIQVWANFATVKSEQTLIEKFSGSSGPGWTFTTPESIQFYQSAHGGYGTARMSFPTGVWQQFVVERNGGSLGIYYDDNLVLSAGIAGAIPSSTNPLLIGARNAADGRNFTVNGLIDDVGIWDRALSPAEIGALWNDGNGLQLGSAVPEPSTWVMMLVGFAGLGYAGYRKAKNGQTALSAC